MANSQQNGLIHMKKNLQLFFPHVMRSNKEYQRRVSKGQKNVAYSTTCKYCSQYILHQMGMQMVKEQNLFFLYKPDFIYIYIYSFIKSMTVCTLYIYQVGYIYFEAPQGHVNIVFEETHVQNKPFRYFLLYQSKHGQKITGYFTHENELEILIVY